MSFPSIGPSLRDCRASLAKALATQLLTAPYALYWYEADVVQTATSTYWTNYRAQQATHLANPALQAALSTSVGLLSIVDPPEPAFEGRDWVVAPTQGGQVPPLGSVPVPLAMVDVDPLATNGAFELGTRAHWRERTCSIDCLVRNKVEQELLADALSFWFPRLGLLDVRNWDSGDGSQVVGTLEWTSAVVSTGTSWSDANPVQLSVGLTLTGTFVG